MARLNWLTLLATAAAFFAATGVGHALELRVVGTATLRAHARATGVNSVVVKGVLSDERTEPIASAVVGVSATLGSGHFHRCSAAPGSALRGDAREALVTTDPAGRFCVLWTTPITVEDAAFSLRFAGNDDYEPTSTRTTVDHGHSALTLRFASAPREIALEVPIHAILIDTEVEDSPLPSALGEIVPLALLIDQAGQTQPVTVGATAVRTGETARIEVPSSKLHGAGPASLVARSPGGGAIGSAEARVSIIVTAAVTLTPAASAREGYAYERSIVILATSPGSNQPLGAVEISLPGFPALSAPLVHGRASLLPPQSHAFTSTVRATYRYLSAGAAWKPGAPLELELSVAPPSPWRHVPWAVAALGVAGWLAKSWRRPRGPSALRASLSPRPRGVPELQVLAQGRPRDGWRGVVVDAHDGAPLAGALVTLHLPRFGGSEPQHGATTATDGTFSLGRISTPEGTRLVVSARLHAKFERPVPLPGTLRVSLVTHRRYLLEALSAWVLRRGRPWHLSDDPTPAEVRLKAKSLDATAVATWALATERAAFGADPVTREAARRVGELERQTDSAAETPPDRSRSTKTSSLPFQR